MRIETPSNKPKITQTFKKIHGNLLILDTHLRDFNMNIIYIKVKKLKL